MYRQLRLAVLLGGCATLAMAQQAMSWAQVKERFRQNNPNLAAGEIAIRESKANETTAGLRPNPVFTSANEQLNLFSLNPYQPLATGQYTQTLSYLVERRKKRPLRVDSARLATAISRADLSDLDRNLAFALRDAFIRVLQGKAILELSGENLKYYDHVLALNRERLNAGDISKVDFLRLELQRVQYESDLENARINLRTAKIALLALMNEQTPIDQFDVAGRFDAAVVLPEPSDALRAAMAARPDLLSAATAVEKAQADHRLAIANGSADPVVSADYGRIGPMNTVGLGFSIPLRIFDKNQGEKERTTLEIQRAEKIRLSIVTDINRDVASAYQSIEGVLKLIKPYQDRYLPESAEVRDTVSFAYSKGGASLLDFLDAQKAYRDAQLNYRNLIAGYLSAVNQLGMAMGTELVP